MTPYEGLRPLVTVLLWSWVLLIVLDIAGMIVHVMAYTGAQSEDDRQVIKDTHITFPSFGDHVQRTEIALSALGFVLHITLATVVMISVGRLRREGDAKQTRTLRWTLLKWPIPWHTACLAAWIVCVVYQAKYVPILGTDQLPECVYYGAELSQCGMLSASWILGMVYVAFHFVIFVCLLEMLRRLKVPDTVKTRQTQPAVNTTAPSAPTERSGSVQYHAVYPPIVAPSTVFAASSPLDEPLPPPPYSEVNLEK